MVKVIPILPTKRKVGRSTKVIMHQHAPNIIIKIMDINSSQIIYIYVFRKVYLFIRRNKKNM